MPTVSTTSRANGAATGAHNPASPGLRPGTSLQAVLAARAGATPAGRPGAAAAGVTPSPAATGGASVGTNDGGTAPEEGTAVAAVLDGAAMQMDDLVAAVMAANRAVLAPAADLYEHLVDGSQKIIVVVAEDSTSSEALLLHSISSVSKTGDIVAMVGVVLRAGGATALKIAGADDLTIRKYGRWRSSTFEDYIHEQIQLFAKGWSTKMAVRTPYINVGAPRVLPAAAA